MPVADAQRIRITEQQALSFPNTLAGTTINLVTPPNGARAAIFSATGRRNTTVTVSIRQRRIRMKTGAGVGATQKIVVRNWRFGGSLVRAGRSATGQFNRRGILTNMRVGATARVRANDIPGVYVGRATLRVVY